MNKYVNNRLEIFRNTIFVFVGIVALLLFITIFVTATSATEPEFINFKLEKSTDNLSWDPVNGNLNTGFILELNSSINYYYIDVQYGSSNVALKQGMYGFNITSYPSDFFDYWNDKGVNSGASPGSWQAHMYDIINGLSPTFYLNVDANQDLSIVDGLNYDFNGVIDTLRVNGDYPLGSYSYEGTIESEDDDTSQISVDTDFVSDIDKLNGPNIISLDLIKSPDQFFWEEQYGSLYSFYSCPLNSSYNYFYFDIDEINFDGELDENYFGFYLDSYPSGYFTYWASEGVDASATTGTWQAHMWKIINGEAPRFYIYYDSATGLSLIDGFYRDFHGYSSNIPLRVNGDLTRGMYCYSGQLTSSSGVDSNVINIDFSFLDEDNYQVWVDNNYDSLTPGWGVDHFAKIKDGLDACLNGGVVHVQPGRYEEIININKPVILRSVWGPTGAQITDDGASYSEFLETDGYTVFINSSHVLFNGFTVERFESVFRTSALGNNENKPSSNIEIKDCVIESFYDCICFKNINYAATCENKYDSQIGRISVDMKNVSSFVTYNDVLDGYDTYGIRLDKCNFGYISNIILNFRRTTGFFINDSETIKIKDNYFSWMENDGIYVNNSNEILIESNNFEKSKTGIRLDQNTIAVIMDNTYDEVDRDIERAVRIEEEDVYYSQLQDAIDTADTGENIYLHEGHYYENIILSKKLSLHGLEDNYETIIYGNSFSPAFLIKSNLDIKNVFIEDLSIQGGYHCLKTGKYNDVSGLIVDNCIIKDPIMGHAVYIDPHNFSDESSVRPGTDIFSNRIQFRYNEIEDGFYYQFWPYEVFTASVNNQLELKYNTIDNVFLNGSFAVVIENNNIQSLGMMYSSDVKIEDNSFENSIDEPKRYGLYLWSVQGTPSVFNIEIKYNSFLEYQSISIPKGVSGKAILISGAKDIDISNNAIRACSDGIYITENYTNREENICAGDVYDIAIEKNDFVLCQSGIKLLDNVNGSSIEDNIFDRNQQGIRIHKSGYHTIKDNTFTENYEGIQLDKDSSNSLIYNNYFDNTAINADDSAFN